MNKDIDTEADELVAYYRNDLYPDIESHVRWTVDRIQRMTSFLALRPLLKTRMKSESSLRAKILVMRDPESFEITKASLQEKIEDLGGIRLVAYSKKDAEQIMLELIKLHRSQDWCIRSYCEYLWRGEDGVVAQELPEVGQEELQAGAGYRSLHFVIAPVAPRSIVRCELQLRTIAEEAIFENWHRLAYKRPPSLRQSILESALSAVADQCAVLDNLLVHCYDIYDRLD